MLIASYIDFVSFKDECADDELRCPDGTCILFFSICDGWSDCADNSDEDVEICGTTTTPMTTMSAPTLPGS